MQCFLMCDSQPTSGKCTDLGWVVNPRECLAECRSTLVSWLVHTNNAHSQKSLGGPGAAATEKGILEHPHVT